jgi:sialic acid synthase SpsE
VTIRVIKKGEALTKDNIWVKRPGTGEILAEHYNKILDKTVNHDIPKDQHLKWSDINS